MNDVPGVMPCYKSLTPLLCKSCDNVWNVELDFVNCLQQALEAAVVKGGDRPVEKSDARAIQSAVMWATGAPPTAGGLAAAAMSAADLNPRVPSADKTTLADILMVCFSACHYLPEFNFKRCSFSDLWYL